MPPKRRKIEQEAKDDDVSDPVDCEGVEVKTEQLSQDDEKESTQSREETEKRATGRNLRPRKSTCYAERESPEIFFDEKQKKLPSRRKRRNCPSEDGLEEKQTKPKRTDKGNCEDESVGQLAENECPQGDVENHDKTEPTFVSSSLANASEAESSKDASESENVSKNSVSEKDPENKFATKQPAERKRPRKKPKPKVDSCEEPPIEPVLVPKEEPLSPSGQSQENKENGEEALLMNSAAAIAQSKPKPKPKRRKKPASATTSASNKPIENDPDGEPVVKQEVIDGDDAGCNDESSLAQSKTDGAENKVAAPPKKKPVRKKKVPSKDPLNPNSENQNKDAEPGEEVKVEGESEKQNEQKENDPAAGTKKPRPKYRPKKPSVTTKTATEEKGADSTEMTTGTLDDKTETNTDAGNEEPKVKAPPTRKPFFRGRRSKSISARSGRKEIIHQEEIIDPQDIRGFEHVEKYSTPAGVRLPKFWDSEDEMSDDENNDNFRRIMCGFGTNCRIHEVIRPASEIVRRLKELQNTFGTTKSLPLFQKDDLNPNDDVMYVTSSEPFLRKDRDRSITWHTDPSFFKYANNYPSRCK